MGFGGGGFGGGGFADAFGDIFGDIFGQGGGRHAGPQVYKGADLRYNMDITLEQAAEGYTTQIRVPSWSNCKPCHGTGKELLMETVELIKEKFPTVTRFVTLSPKTEMAKRFHTKNGAVTFRENQESVNYEYQIYK